MTRQGGMPEAVTGALEAAGLDPSSAELVSPLGEAKRFHLAWRVATVGGGTVKARLMRSPEEAAENVRLRAGLPPEFAPVLARHGAVLLEEWVDEGDAGPLPGERPAEAARVLARLHAAGPPAGVPEESGSGPWIADAQADATELAGLGLLSDRDAGELPELLARLDPGPFRTAVIHRELCPENLLVDRAGMLRVIDNEWLMTGPAGWDITYTRLRWPLEDEAWAEFLSAYESEAPVPAGLGFWAIVSGLFGARILHDRDPRGCERYLAALAMRLAEGRAPEVVL